MEDYTDFYEMFQSLVEDEDEPEGDQSSGVMQRILSLLPQHQDKKNPNKRGDR